jgi:hypothetical protein
VLGSILLGVGGCTLGRSRLLLCRFRCRTRGLRPCCPLFDVRSDYDFRDGVVERGLTASVDGWVEVS